MGKRSRSDRKKAREHRAATGEWAGVRALCERNPGSGAKALASWLQDRGHGEVDPEVLDVAARTSARLRADCRFDQALALCAAAGGRTVELRMEEAVGAFATGNHARVRELATLDPAVARMVAPWLAAVDGERVPSALPGSSKSWRTVLAVCRVVSALVQGRTAKVRELLAPIRQPERSRFFVTELMDASSLLSARHDHQMDVAVSLSRSSIVRATPQARAALAMAVARQSPKLFLDQLLHEMDLGEEDMRDAAIHASCAISGLDGPQASVSLMIARLGADAFAPDERANALLYEGFAFSHADPMRARRAIDRAVALGADLIEALRGRLLVDRASLCPTGAASGPPQQEALRGVASNASSLATHLMRDPDGAPLAAVALLEASQASVGLRQNDKARDFIAKARQLAVQGGFLTEALEVQLDLHEADALSRSDPKRALDLADRVIARDPKHPVAWDIKIALVARSDREAADHLILQASELKVSPQWSLEARRVRKERGISLAMVPGQTTAGELAAEMLSRITGGRKSTSTRPHPDPDMEACRAALDLDHRAAFDVATIAILASHAEPSQVVDRFVELATDPSLSAAHTQKLAAVAVTLDNEVLCSMLHRVARAGRPALAADALRMLVRDDDAELAEDILPKLAPVLGRTELGALQQLIRDATRGRVPPGLPDPRKILSATDSLLAPDLSVVELLAEDDPLDFEMTNQVQQMLLDLRNHPRGVPGALEQFFDALGVPRSRLRGMNPHKRQRVEGLFRTMLDGPGLPGLFEVFGEMCEEMGLEPPGGFDEPLPF